MLCEIMMHGSPQALKKNNKFSNFKMKLKKDRFSVLFMLFIIGITRAEQKGAKDRIRPAGHSVARSALQCALKQFCAVS